MKTTFKKLLINESQTKFLNEESAIREWLDKMGVEDYSINGDMTVSVKGPLSLDDKNLEEIPVKFSEVGGSIDVTSNKLKRIDWAPATVNGDFDAWDNEIETLQGGPTEVKGSYDVDGNKITDLHGSPKTVGVSFIVSKNPLHGLAGCPQSVGSYFKAEACNLTEIDDLPRSVGTNIYLQGNHISSLKNINKFLKEVNAKNDAKGGKVVLSANPITAGISALLAIKGFKEVVFDGVKGQSSSYQELIKVAEIINKGLKANEDPFDIQEKILDSDWSSFA